jgi:hypothetical protein
MVNFDPNLSLSENWDAGDHLGDAWFLHAAENLKCDYRASESDTDIRDTVRMFMEMNVQGSVASGKLSALALQSKPVSNGAPMVIPHTYFKAPDIEIDWDLSLARWHDHHFASITIVAGYVACGADTPATMHAPDRKKPGPKRIDDLIASAIRDLQSRFEHFDKWIQEKKINEIRERIAVTLPLPDVSLG